MVKILFHFQTLDINTKIFISSKLKNSLHIFMIFINFIKILTLNIYKTKKFDLQILLFLILLYLEHMRNPLLNFYDFKFLFFFYRHFKK